MTVIHLDFLLEIEASVVFDITLLRCELLNQPQINPVTSIASNFKSHGKNNRTRPDEHAACARAIFSKYFRHGNYNADMSWTQKFDVA